MSAKISIGTEETAPEMSIGDLGIIYWGGPEEHEHIVLRMHTGIVSLSNPNLTWRTDDSTWDKLKVRILPFGTSVTVTS